MFLDTGSSVSLIKPAFLKKLSSVGYEHRMTNIKIGTTNGKEIPVYGEIQIPFALDEITFQHGVLLTPANAYPGDMLVGTDWLEKLGPIQFDFETHTVRIDGKVFPFRRAGQLRTHYVTRFPKPAE